MTKSRFLTRNDISTGASSGRRRVTCTSSSLVATLLMIAGCSNSNDAPKYQVPSTDRVVSISAADLGVEPVTFSRCGAHTLFSEPTQGEFPSAVCVVRVESFENESDQRRLRIVPLPVHHAVYWNHLFDELPAVREIVFLGKPGLDPRGYGWEDILDVSLAREAGLCMIYARLEDTDADAEYAGILWNTRKRTALATVRVPVVLPADVLESLEEDEDCDSAIAEADFRSEQEFRRLVRDLVWDIARQDVAVNGGELNPWKEYVPPFPGYDRHRFPGLEQPIPYNSPGRTKKRDSSKADEPESDVIPVDDETPGLSPLGTRVAGDPQNVDD